MDTGELLGKLDKMLQGWLPAMSYFQYSYCSRQKLITYQQMPGGNVGDTHRTVVTTLGGEVIQFGATRHRFPPEDG